MQYHIETKDGIRIASFIHEQDRDICLDVLAEYWEDCIFKPVDE